MKINVWNKLETHSNKTDVKIIKVIIIIYIKIKVRAI